MLIALLKFIEQDRAAGDRLDFEILLRHPSGAAAGMIAKLANNLHPLIVPPARQQEFAKLTANYAQYGPSRHELLHLLAQQSSVPELALEAIQNRVAPDWDAILEQAISRNP